MHQEIIVGTPGNLRIPKSHLAEYMSNGIDLDHATKEMQEAAGYYAVGYKTNWGQLLECRESEDNIKWEIRFDSLHREFLDAGGNGNELADCCVQELINLSHRKGIIPPYLTVDDGNSGSTAACLWLSDPEYEKKARRYIATTFLLRVMPVVVGRIRRLNNEMANKRRG